MSTGPASWITGRLRPRQPYHVYIDEIVAAPGAPAYLRIIVANDGEQAIELALASHDEALRFAEALILALRERRRR